VKAVAAAGRIIAAYEPADLPGAISAARHFKGTKPMPPQGAITLIGQAIEQLCTSSA
jgi:hypothetical protein